MNRQAPSGHRSGPKARQRAVYPPRRACRRRYEHEMPVTGTDPRSTPRRGGEPDSRTTRDGRRLAARSTACCWPFAPTNSARNAERHFTAGFSPALPPPGELVRVTDQPQRRRSPNAELPHTWDLPAIRNRRATPRPRRRKRRGSAVSRRQPRLVSRAVSSRRVGSVARDRFYRSPGIGAVRPNVGGAPPAAHGAEAEWSVVRPGSARRR